MAWALLELGSVTLMQGEQARAQAVLQESLILARELGHAKGMRSTLVELARVFTAQGWHERAARLLGAAEALTETLGGPPIPALHDWHSRLVDTIRANLGEGIFRRVGARAGCCRWSRRPPMRSSYHQPK
jgi:non-specific serine/threonine protein kinase